ncbi:hypothetical protein [Lactobacillus terrae]|nr:hypothetical protein [Lactobacillus terrae]
MKEILLNIWNASSIEIIIGLVIAIVIMSVIPYVISKWYLK